MQARLKIAFVLTPVDFGGAERVSANLLEYVDRKSFELIPILLIRPWEKRNTFIEKLKKLDYRYVTIPVAKQPSVIRKDRFRVPRCYKLMYKFIKKSRPDIVHSNGYFADLLCIPLSSIFRIPVLSTCHGYISTGRKLRLYNAADIVALRFCDRILAVSDHIKSKLIQCGIKEGRVEIIQNAVPLMAANENKNENRKQIRKRYNVHNNDLLLGYAGRFSREKGVRYLLETCRKLDVLNISYKLLLIGEGPEKDFLNNITIERKFRPGKIIFSGFVQNVQNYLAALDVFVLPSLTEGTPMALLEAMAMGIPVVATSVGGVPKVVKHMENGLLVKPGDPMEIVNALVAMARDVSLRGRLSLNAINTIRNNFDIKSWINRIEEVYTNVARPKAKR